LGAIFITFWLTGKNGGDMKITKIIEKLEEIKSDIGDVECLIELKQGIVCLDEPVGEIAVEDRWKWGLSVKFII
jgi:hypothetical protein